MALHEKEKTHTLSLVIDSKQKEYVLSNFQCHCHSPKLSCVSSSRATYFLTKGTVTLITVSCLSLYFSSIHKAILDVHKNVSQLVLLGY